jgi:hypothetical protein
MPETSCAAIDLDFSVAPTSVRALSAHQVVTAFEQGWSTLRNAEHKKTQQVNTIKTYTPHPKQPNPAVV